MAKFKATKSIAIPFLGTIESGSVIDNISTDATKLSFKDAKGGTYTVPMADYKASLASVPDTTATALNITYSGAGKAIDSLGGGVKTFARGAQIGGLIGTVGGVLFARHRKSGVGGYIGWAVLFGGVFMIVGGYIGAKKAMKDASK